MTELVHVLARGDSLDGARRVPVPAAAADGRQLPRDQSLAGEGRRWPRMGRIRDVLRLPLVPVGSGHARRAPERAAGRRARMSADAARALRAELERFTGPVAPGGRARRARRRSSRSRPRSTPAPCAPPSAAPDGELARQRLGQGRHPARLPARPHRSRRRPAARSRSTTRTPIRCGRSSVDDGIRIVPGGSAIRDGCYVAPGVVCMPPMYINVGAYVGEGTMVDSHALVGSCAQIGRRVHLSAAAQIGGVLEPAGALPGDHRGRGAGRRQLRRVRGHDRARARRARAGHASSPAARAVFDLVHDRVYRRDGDRPLEIPAGAVVVPGTRPVRIGPGRGGRHRPLRAGHREVPRREDRHRGPPRGAAALSHADPHALPLVRDQAPPGDHRHHR